MRPINTCRSTPIPTPQDRMLKELLKTHPDPEVQKDTPAPNLPPSLGVGGPGSPPSLNSLMELATTPTTPGSMPGAGAGTRFPKTALASSPGLQIPVESSAKDARPRQELRDQRTLLLPAATPPSPSTCSVQQPSKRPLCPLQHTHTPRPQGRRWGHQVLSPASHRPLGSVCMERRSGSRKEP